MGRRMPEAPNLEGYPQWLQVVVSLAFAALTIIIGVRGYKAGPKQDETKSNTTIAHLSDMGAVRHLTTATEALHVEILSHNRLVADHTHYLREQIDVNREICQRLRELREAMDRQRPR